MFHNFLDKRVYIQGVVDPKTGKEYLVHIESYIAPNGPLAGFICNEVYITVPDPSCDVLVGIGKKAFADDEFDSPEDMLAELGTLVEKMLPSGFERFEAIMENGLSGNEHIIG